MAAPPAISTLNDPRVCQFDPNVLQCKGADGPTCLTGAEVDAVRKLYAGPSQNNRSLFPGFEPGSEAAWSPGVGTFTTNLYRSMVYPSNTTWDVHDFNFTTDVDAIHKTLSNLIDSNRTDMSAFRSRGGKILMWHGWTDTTLEPRESIHYYNRVVAANAAAPKGADPDRAQLADTGTLLPVVHGAGRESLRRRVRSRISVRVHDEQSREPRR